MKEPNEIDNNKAKDQSIMNDDQSKILKRYK